MERIAPRELQAWPDAVFLCRNKEVDGPFALFLLEA
jgi:hypothetical protein